MAERTDKTETSEASEGTLTTLICEAISNPLNICLLVLIAVIIYKLWKPHKQEKPQPKEPELAKMKKKDFYIHELKPFDGNGPEGRILVAVNGKVFDVTRGKRFYGPGGPYSSFAGRDASRALATFSVEDAKDTYDDLSDLDVMQMDSVREWEMQFTERYEFVGRLLKPGEECASYSDEEDEGIAVDSKPAEEKKAN